MRTTEPWRRVAGGAGLLSPDGHIAPTIFAEMSALASQTGAINLGQGFPDEDGPDAVLDAAREAISAGVNQYPPGRGNPVLLEALARHTQRFSGRVLDPGSEILVTAGATEALAATLLALVQPGDDVVTFEPYYDAYGGLIALAGGRHVGVPLRFPDFQPDPEDLRRAVTDRTRIILVNDPHNPTGTVFSDETRSLLVELAERHDALLVTDEVYEHLRFDGAHVPLANIPGASERTITISSAGKTFNTTGWKIGWALGPAPLITAITTVKQYLSYVNGAPFQPAIAVGLELPDAYFRTTAATLERRATLLGNGLRDVGLDIAPCRAGYFLVADVTSIGEATGEQFCRELPGRAGVVAIPVTAFVSPERRADYAGLVRFAFCKRDAVLEEAVGRMRSLSGTAR